ncbi:NACHT domain-containing protein [Mycena chlorophos]|uniref:NACHT domain-containing protein n=1 Tax=Mycena chlorophos TaxID=658473 RepID=A0A8H6RV18_MYCCL|nr:NACHT domain-containing protein [Mycena chlorophos]
MPWSTVTAFAVQPVLRIPTSSRDATPALCLFILRIPPQLAKHDDEFLAVVTFGYSCLCPKLINPGADGHGCATTSMVLDIMREAHIYGGTGGAGGRGGLQGGHGGVGQGNNVQISTSSVHVYEARPEEYHKILDFVFWNGKLGLVNSSGALGSLELAKLSLLL